MPGRHGNNPAAVHLHFLMHLHIPLVPHGALVLRTAPPIPQNFTRDLPQLLRAPSAGCRANGAYSHPRGLWQPQEVGIRVPASESKVPGYFYGLLFYHFCNVLNLFKLK